MKFTVWYAKTPLYSIYAYKGTWERLSVTDLDKTHVMLKEIDAPDRDEAWVAMQGENWSPQGEARELIKSKGLTHTSMSIGDILQDEDHRYWVANDHGWAELPDVAPVGETFRGKALRDLGLLGLTIAPTVRKGDILTLERFRVAPDAPASIEYYVIQESGTTVHFSDVAIVEGD